MKAYEHSRCFGFIYLQTYEDVQLEKRPNYQQGLFCMLPEVQMLFGL